MSYIYRCSRCRTRNTFLRALSTYVRAKRCRDCGHDHFYVDKERTQRKPCRCSGYHHPHRPGSPLCEHNPTFDVRRAQAQGLDHDDMAWHGIGARVLAAHEAVPF